jgi:hypothetical protein
VGGQLVPERDLAALRDDVKDGRLLGWDGVHGRYRELSEAYDNEKLRHAYASLLKLREISSLTKSEVESVLTQYVITLGRLAAQVSAQRQADLDDPFRKASYGTSAEEAAVLAKPDQIPFISVIKREAENAAQGLANLLKGI